MALGSTPPLTEMSTRSISSGDKGGRRLGLTTLPPSSAVVTKSGNLNLLEPSGPLQACNGTDVNIFIPLHSVRLEVLTAGSIQALCAWWQSTQFSMKYELHFTRLRALILQDLTLRRSQ
jgi:hypothetical protein